MQSEKQPPKIRSRDVQGLKYFKVLQPLLERLHGVGNACGKAKQRILHMDQYCNLILLRGMTLTTGTQHILGELRRFGKL